MMTPTINTLNRAEYEVAVDTQHRFLNVRQKYCSKLLSGDLSDVRLLNQQFARVRLT